MAKKPRFSISSEMATEATKRKAQEDMRRFLEELFRKMAAQHSREAQIYERTARKWLKKE